MNETRAQEGLIPAPKEKASTGCDVCQGFISATAAAEWLGITPRNHRK
jgi:hypothetical protein